MRTPMQRVTASNYKAEVVKKETPVVTNNYVHAPMKQKKPTV